MKSIPVLDWRRIENQMIAWINDIECYTLKPVVYIGDSGPHPQWELRIDNVATSQVELIGVYIKPEIAFAEANAHVGDS